MLYYIHINKHFPQVIDHYENPRNVGTLNKNDKNVGTGLVGAPACGDVMKLQIKVDDGGRIVDAKFKTFGCGSAIASSSLATEWVMGKTVSLYKYLLYYMIYNITIHIYIYLFKYLIYYKFIRLMKHFP